MDNDTKDRAYGMMFGLVIGDILGAPVQFDTDSQSICANIEKLKDFHDNQILPKGVYTDDTSMTLCLADSLIEKQGYDSYDVMKKYSDWAAFGYRSYFNYGYDVGRQTDEAIADFAKNPVVEKNRKRETSAGNGGIMRLAPTIVATIKANDLTKTVELAWISSRETHYSETAEMGAELFANILYRALRSKNKNEIISFEDLHFTTDEMRECFLDHEWLLKPRIKSNGACLRDLGGFVIDAITIALWGFLQAKDFEDGMLKVLMLGGDTDTNCAIYGQLAGAYYGFKNIPKRWIDNMAISKEELFELTDRLLKMKKSPIIQTRFEEDDYFKIPEKENYEKPNN